MCSFSVSCWLLSLKIETSQCDLLVLTSLPSILIVYIFIHVSFKSSGTWSDDKASGVGKLEYSNGDVYEGQWDRDQRHGKDFVPCFCFCTVVEMNACVSQCLNERLMELHIIHAILQMPHSLPLSLLPSTFFQAGASSPLTRRAASTRGTGRTA